MGRLLTTLMMASLLATVPFAAQSAAVPAGRAELPCRDAMGAYDRVILIKRNLEAEIGTLRRMKDEGKISGEHMARYGKITRDFDALRSEWNSFFADGARDIANFGPVSFDPDKKVEALSDAAMKLEPELKILLEDLSNRLVVPVLALPELAMFAVGVAALYFQFDSWLDSRQDRAEQKDRQAWAACASHLKDLVFQPDR